MTAVPSARPTEAFGRDRLLLAGGVLAGPIFVGSALVQSFTRDGFDFRRHAVSVLSTGELGWIQILTFLVTGLLTIGAARTLPRLSAGGPVWIPRLLTLYGVGLAGAGIFSADPGDGFPAGTPRGSGQISWHGGLHFLAAAVAFVSLIVATVLLARRSARSGDRLDAAAHLIVGTYFGVAWLAMIVAPGQVTMVGFGLAVAVGWAWVTVVLARVGRS
ncbi:DUF998 domain-containing protein [Micromonospora sp. NPDC023737]|uniref:DUF998 domain-containing protein n=1 Tax=unclassified Micromonospora TaxID=2617518 RepID=UPI0033EB9FD3